jgi:uncharacterized protein YbcI
MALRQPVCPGAADPTIDAPAKPATQARAQVKASTGSTLKPVKIALRSVHASSRRTVLVARTLGDADWGDSSPSRCFFGSSGRDENRAESMSQAVPERHEDASIAARLSNHVGKTMTSYTGRGPTKAWTTMDGDLICVVLRDTLTKGERSLVADGRAQLVLDMRKAYQYTMRHDLVSGVEEISGRKVIAFLSDNHIDPDIAIESFVLQPNGGTTPADTLGE